MTGTHTRQISDYGGVASVMPVYASMFMVFTLASIGLPATNGFIGEFLVILEGSRRINGQACLQQQA